MLGNYTIIAIIMTMAMTNCDCGAHGRRCISYSEVRMIEEE